MSVTQTEDKVCEFVFKGWIIVVVLNKNQNFVQSTFVAALSACSFIRAWTLLMDKRLPVCPNSCMIAEAMPFSKELITLSTSAYIVALALSFLFSLRSSLYSLAFSKKNSAINHIRHLGILECGMSFNTLVYCRREIFAIIFFLDCGREIFSISPVYIFRATAGFLIDFRNDDI